MLTYYIKSSWRNMLRNPSFSVINILGLAIGLTGFILILLYLNYEKSYDTWDPALKNIYKVEIENNEGIQWDGRTQAPLANFLKQNYPKVLAATRISSSGNSDFEILVEANGKKMYQKGMIEVDSLFFTVFPYQFIKGNKNLALLPPDAVVLEESFARAYFGDKNPVGEPIFIFGGMFKGKITGVIKSPSGPSVLNAKLLMRSPYENSNNHWQNFSYESYMKLPEALSTEVVEKDINRVYQQSFVSSDKVNSDTPKKDKNIRYITERFTQLHTNPKSGGSNLPIISVLLALAASLLIAGAINFSNLSLADAFSRAKEVGVKKVLGSGRKQLFWQFINDVALQVILALVVASGLVLLIAPWFKNQFNIRLSFFQPGAGSFYLQIGLCLLLTILIAGAYPALLLSGFKPVKVLKGDISQGKKGFSFRNVLTLFQFVLSGFFIICSLIIYQQIDFMQKKDKGFDSQQVMRIQTTQPTREQNFDQVRQKLLSLPGVIEVAKTTTVPGDASVDTTLREFKWKDGSVKLNEVKVSTEYFSLINTVLVQGRWFDRRYADQHTRSAIINESAAKSMGIADPVGEIIRFPYCDTVPVEVIGVVKDFNIQGMNTPIRPTMFNIGNFACGMRSGGAVLVKIDASHTQQTLSAIEKAWKEIEPEFPLNYSFLNDNFQKLLKEYLRVQQVVAYFTVVAILIAVMGLFAMSVFLVKEKTRELGIRKVLGAGIKDIIKVTSSRFLMLVVIAMVVAVPLGWLATQAWLQNFAYRITPGMFVFISATLLLLVIAAITVSFQAIKAAMANPVKSLRTE